MVMTEDEYIRYLAYLWKRDFPDRRVKYPIDDGCNCLHRSHWEMEYVKVETHRCHCLLVHIGFKRAGMRYVWNDYSRHGNAKQEYIDAWKERMARRVNK